MVAPRKTLRRLSLAGLGLLALGAPALASSCAADFAPQSRVEGLRVLAVVADDPYPAPGDTVTFTMTAFDGYVDPDHPDASKRAFTITWLGGCFDPDGDEYYACYPQLADLFAGLSGGSLDPSLLQYVGLGDTFSLAIPDDIVTRRPKPADGVDYYGSAYVFFAACAGTLKPVPTSDAGAAGSFPLGCFDEDGNQLGAESFVPGYTQVYTFDDGRKNKNPEVTGMTIGGKTLSETDPPKVKRCAASEDSRLAAPSCGKPSPTAACTSYDISVKVPTDVAEADPDGTTEDGKPLTEAVWVDYYAEKGDFDSDVQLVNDATNGYVKDHHVSYTPPPDKGAVRLWAVVHDARGGQTVIEREVLVE